jgi:hypothetical protein
VRFPAQHLDLALSSQPLREDDILKQPYVVESAHASEDIFTNEYGLIAV